MQSIHTLAWFTLFIALHMFVHALHAPNVARADTESRMSVAVVGLHDSKNLPHDCVRRLHVVVGRARQNFRPIGS